MQGSNTNKAGKILEVNYDRIQQAMEDIKRDRHDYYLDLETGAVVRISEGALRNSLATLYTSDPDDNVDEDILVDSEIDTSAEMPDEILDALETSLSVILDSERYARIPERDSREAFAGMRKFADSVEKGPLKDSLLHALGGRNSFRKFKKLLADHQRERKKWHTFNAKQMRSVIRAWIEDLGFRPVRERKG